MPMNTLHAASPAVRYRLPVALIFGVIATGICYAFLAAHADREAGDFTWAVRGAERWITGRDPYVDPSLGQNLPYPYDAPLFYPLPALVVGLPFIGLPRDLAGALFFGLSSGLLAYGLFRDGYARLPLFLGAPYWFAMYCVQWSPLLTAAALLVPLLPLALVKPNIGVPIVLAYGSRCGILMCLVIWATTIAIFPGWMFGWFANLGAHRNFVPILLFPPLALAALRWRDPSARLLLLLSLVPQRLLYDQLLLGLIPQTFRHSLVLASISWIGLFGGLFDPARAEWWVTGALLVPALVLVLHPVVRRCGQIERYTMAKS